MWWGFQSHHGSCVHILGGLPCIGTFYDEVDPSVKELQKVDGYEQPYLPRSCHYLLMAYHRLQGRMKGQWLGHFFCFRGDPIYPTPRKQAKKTNLPKHSQNPSSVIRELQEVYGYPAAVVTFTSPITIFKVKWRDNEESMIVSSFGLGEILDILLQESKRRTRMFQSIAKIHLVS